ncbi:ABC transporter substrate-binding protein [Georgenia halophila]|uniref:ABC transporter substrate-binding protein n=1 Tax=Georgenia halophila TaxID=620889 RepID=A0ABP8LKF3_9MICO
MKRTSAIKVAATAMGAVLLAAACSEGSADTGSGGEPADPEEVSGDVTFWFYPIGVSGEASWWEPHIEAFNEEYPNVNIDAVPQSFSNREDSLVTAVAGNNAPDVVYFNPDFIPQWAEEDLLLPLDDLRDDWDDFYDSSLDSMSWEGTLYGAPLLMQMMTSYCNADALEAADVECPTTWDEFREAAPAFKEAGYYPTEYQGTTTLNHTYYPFLWQAGGQVLSDDLQSAAFNSPEGLEALEFVKEMVDNEWVPQQPLTVNEPFEQTPIGRAEVGYVRGANLTQTREVVDPELIEVVPPMSNEEQVASGSVGAWSIFNTTESPEAAKAWVRFLSSEDFIATFNEETGYLPPRESIDYLFEDDPQTAQGMEYLDTVRVGVMHPQARQIIDVIRPHIQSVLVEGNDPQAALDAAEEDVNELLARG